MVSIISYYWITTDYYWATTGLLLVFSNSRHIHPLETISKNCRNALKQLHINNGSYNTLYGKDFYAGNLVYCINKLRYQDGPGAPAAFRHFLDINNLKSSIFVLYGK